MAMDKGKNLRLVLGLRLGLGIEISTVSLNS